MLRAARASGARALGLAGLLLAACEPPAAPAPGAASPIASPAPPVTASPSASPAPPASPAALDRRAACLARNRDAPERYRGLVRAFCADHHNLGGVGASLAVAEGGALRFTATAGQRCAGGPEVTVDTAFRLGSLTKLLTAALALRLADERRLDLDVPLTDLLPELGGAADPRHQAITLRQLLGHSAGLGDPGPRELGADPWAWLPALLARPLLAEPGAARNYANSGYALVGLALERSVDQPYPELLHRRLLAPLGVPRISAEPAQARARGAACGHLGRGARVLALDVVRDLELGAAGARWTIPAGGVIAAPTDLVALALGLVDPLRSPLSAAAIATLTVPEPPGTHALGLRARALPGGGALLLHAGDTGDFAADLALAPDRGFVLVIASNTGDHLQATLAAALTDLLGLAPAPR